jgi:hypothetical protein
MFVGDWLLALIGVPVVGALLLLATLLFIGEWRLALAGGTCCAFYGAVLVLCSVGGVSSTTYYVLLALLVFMPAFCFLVFIICTFIAVRRGRVPGDAA